MISLLLFLSEHIESLATKNVTKKVLYPCLVLNSSVQNTLESCVDQIQRKVLAVPNWDIIGLRVMKSWLEMTTNMDKVNGNYS